MESNSIHLESSFIKASFVKIFMIAGVPPLTIKDSFGKAKSKAGESGKTKKKGWGIKDSFMTISFMA